MGWPNSRADGEPCASYSVRWFSPCGGAIGNIAVFAGVLTVIFLIWATASLVIFAMFYTREMPIQWPLTQVAVPGKPRNSGGLFWGRLDLRSAGFRGERSPSR